MANRKDEAGRYEKDYIDCTENLPTELQRHVTVMEECYARQQMMLSQIKEIRKTFDGTDTESKAEKLTKLLLSGREVGDKKVETVQNIVDAVDDRVRRLDNSAEKYLNSVKISDFPKSGTKEKTENLKYSKERLLPSTSASAVAKEQRKLGTENDDSESNNDTKISKRPKRIKEEPDYREHNENVVTAVQHSNTPFPRSTATAQVQSQVLLKKSGQKTETKPKKKSKFKKPQKESSPTFLKIKLNSVDPNEPTYCLCDQISYGEMICCDNDLCPIEWFHFSCVSLQSKPKGKWFCPKCRGDRPSLMKPKAQFLKELVRYNQEKEENA